MSWDKHGPVLSVWGFVYVIQEGLLLGESVGEEKSKITDSQTDHIQFVHTISKSFYHTPACVLDANAVGIRPVMVPYVI